MDGAHVSFLKPDLDKVRLSGDYVHLGELTAAALYRLATKHRLRFELLLPQLDAVMAKVREEFDRFSDDPNSVYPPPGKQRLCVQVDLPKESKVKNACAWESVISV